MVDSGGGGRWLVGVASALFVLATLAEGFETFVLPRRVLRRLRFARLWFRESWRLWAAVGRRVRDEERREGVLAVYGPVSLLGLLAAFAAALILGFAGLHWALGSSLDARTAGPPGFFTDLYLSGTTLFTLGLGDVAPRTAAAKAITVLESGIGLGFLALAVAYLPVLYQAFSQRETAITLLDARAGSPPHAAGLLSGCPGKTGVEQLLRDFELWIAQTMESHLSYPVLAFYRSQHAGQSWLSALTAILDVCVLVLANEQDPITAQAKLTLRIGQHALSDLSRVLGADAPKEVDEGRRLGPLEIVLLEARLPNGYKATGEAGERLRELRRSYEPQVEGLSRLLVMPLPAWWRDE
ncbi:MAG TPA: potassium channel family protein [Myxococcales bacterium]